MPQRDGPEAVPAVKSSALWVIFRTGEVLGGAEMFLICNVGAMHTDRYADLSQTDCMMLALPPAPAPTRGPSTIKHCYSPIQPARWSWFSFSGRVSFFVFCCFCFISVSSPTHVHAACVQTNRL